jgi:hypothetical protein
LRNNSLESLPKNLFNNMNQTLKILYLSFNQIKNLNETSIESLFFLNYISLRGNKLKELPTNIFKKMNGSLKIVHLENNEIETLDSSSLDSLSYLEILFIKNNKIKYLKTNFFFEMKNSLLQLELSNNQIETLNETAIESLSNLQQFYLQNNNIKSLPNNTFFLMSKTLKKLNMGNISIQNSGFNLIQDFNFLYFSFHLLSPVEKCQFHKRFQNPKKFNRIIKGRQYYHGNFLGDDSIESNEGCKFMLHFFKFKIVFNLFYNEDKIHNCMIELRKSEFYSKTSNVCNQSDQSIRSFSNKITILSESYSFRFSALNMNLIYGSGRFYLLFLAIYLLKKKYF